MAQKRRYNNQRNQRPRRAGTGSNGPPPIEAPREKKPPVQYGKPFTILEDEAKNTFEYKAGAWVPYPMTILQCREDCQVTELPQKVNRMTRYEIRRPIECVV